MREQRSPAELLVGLDVADDAAVYIVALDIAAWPEDAPLSQLQRIFQGAIDKVAEAGGVVAGGHTVIDREPKYGLAVTGRVHPERILLKSRLREGDALWLTKPIGTGVLTTA